MDNRPVGIFDSGFGGLSALAEFRKKLPEENILYFGDNGRVPYGSKSREELRGCARNNISFLVRSGAKAVLAACGTCSLIAGDIIAGNAVPGFDVLSPSVDLLRSRDEDGPLGIIATQASIDSHGFETALRKAGVRREIISVPCPDFVTLIEAGIPYSDERVKKAVAGYLAPIRAAGATALLLGCTHYGIIEPALREYLGGGVEIVSASACGADTLARQLTGSGATGGSGEVRFFTSGDPEIFRKTASVILGYDIGDVVCIPEWEDA